MSFEQWIILGIVAISGISAGVAIPICRTIRQRQVVDLTKHVFDKKGVQGLKAMPELIKALGMNVPEPDSPPQFRAVQAGMKMLPGRKRRQPARTADPPNVPAV
ncbi:hypothetical protein [Dactylosporangium sp. NPDC051541]|uniref:hypothetical protein n=1 Tax=Dactylosporangium sp. NPDC051541 TaxID=3363977 RepID=UPI0037B2DDF3